MNQETHRQEQDSLGSIAVPKDALYGAQTQRACQNFQFSGKALAWEIIEALGLIKSLYAQANASIGLLTAQEAQAIVAATKTLIQYYPEAFPVDIYQTGSGTSSNMNVNEVLAHLAGKMLGASLHPNDVINLGQSSNDVFPAAIRIAIAQLFAQDLLPTLENCLNTIEHLAEVHQTTLKTARTHLMDALPITFAQELTVWHEQLAAHRPYLQQALRACQALPLGGTAVGNGINFPQGLKKPLLTFLQQALGTDFTLLKTPGSAMAGQEALVFASSGLRGLASSLYKISNDLRWMNSGPYAGLAEITLPALQPGSSIMPGKVNPVIPEAIMMICLQIQGYDNVIIQANAASNFQLNVMLPVMGQNLIEGSKLLSQALRHLNEKVLKNLTVHEKNLNKSLAHNPILVTALNPLIGYDKAAAIAKKAYAEQRSIYEVALEDSGLDAKTLAQLLDPLRLSQSQENSEK
jgi:fumarate hydratase class II